MGSRMGGLRGGGAREGGGGGRRGVVGVVASLLWCLDGRYMIRLVMFESDSRNGFCYCYVLLAYLPSLL